MSAVYLSKAIDYIKREEKKTMCYCCKECTHCKTLYKRDEDNHYRLSGVYMCDINNKMLEPCAMSCNSFQSPVIFTKEDRQALDRLTLKLSQSTNIAY